MLHLVRDGRDVALSFRYAPFGPKHVYQAAQHWTRYDPAMLDYHGRGVAYPPTRATRAI